MKTLRTVWFVLLAVLLITPVVPSPAQDEEAIFAAIKRGHDLEVNPAHQPAATAAPAPRRALIVTPQAIDVRHYRLQIQLTPDPPQMSGAVTIEGKTLAPVDSISIDAYSNLKVDSVKFDGQRRGFQRRDDHIVLGFSDALPANESFTIVVDYHGRPVTSGRFGGGMLVTRHGAVRVMATLSEPYAGPTWWPSVDNPADKATAEIEATVPRGFVVASNGVLEKVEQAAGRRLTYFWRETHPIATYLVSVATTNYEQFEDTYTALDGVTTMPLVYYVYPEHLRQTQQKFAVTRRAMEIFAPLFGEYPFLDEKYGMVEFPWGGAMEHQTMTSMGDRIVNFGDYTVQDFIVHELAHQWWGDLVTLATWHDIWLNEGFATYSEVLFFERFLGLDPGDLMDRNYDDHNAFGRLGGTVYAEDLEDPFDDAGAIYDKGGWVLHMLRHILGDEAFFAALKEYGQRFAFANASTEDFQRVCEEHYGAPLDWFFQQWIFAPRRPIYQVTSAISGADESGEYTVGLTIEQTQSQTIPGREGALEQVYIMPIDVTIHYADGSRETRVVWNDARRQEFSFTVSKPPIGVGIDEGHWILKQLQ